MIVSEVKSQYIINKQEVYKNKFRGFVFCNRQLFTFVNRKHGENRKFEEFAIMKTEEMKDRIAHIIRAKNMTAAEFALRLGIQPSNISHLLSGRNNPSLDFVKKLKETFPEYNLDWIVFGTGAMTVSEPFEPVPQVETRRDAPIEGSLFTSFDAPESNATSASLANHSRLKHIILVYEDNGFEVLSPR